MPWQRKAGETRDAYDARLLETVAGERPDIVLLLGWMHLLDARFVNAMPALLNVHPAFLPLDPERDAVGMPDGTEIPAFRGPFAVRDALAAGSRWAGASVHHVTAKTDRGGVLVRAPLNIEEGESEEDVLTRLHPVEHALVARAIWRWTFERPERHETAAAS
jgi:phosphoribosylglycinamide formyltransferase-1